MIPSQKLLTLTLSLLLLAVTITPFTFNKLFKDNLHHTVVTDDCNNFDNQNACRGNQTQNDESWQNRNFQTPPRGDPLWKQTYQNYSIIVGYAQVKYDSTDRTSATVKVVTRLNPKYKTDAKLKYYFNGVGQDSAEFQMKKSSMIKSDNGDGLLNIDIEVISSSGNGVIARNTLDPVDFVWNHPSINLPGNYQNGQKGAIVEMFGWPYEDVAKQCVMLGKAGYLGVKVFPPQESILDYSQPQNGELNPWYWLYQPTSYRLHSRMGTAQQLRSMINKCRENNVRVYADAVVNHMAGNGNDVFPTHCSGSVYWGAKNSSGWSPFYSQGFAYQKWKFTNERPGMEFPAVPYGPRDFHCARALNSWTDGFILNYGWLVNLADLNTESDYVRQRIADYFTDLMGMGFSGIRIDAAKHISPTNLAAILAKFKSKMGGALPEDFIAYLQVIIGGEKDLLMCQDNPYNFGASFAKLMSQAGLTDTEINKIKIWQSDYPKEFPLCGWPIPSERYAIQLDCHDDQFPGSSSRDMGDTGSILVKEKNVDRHRDFEVQMLTRTDGNWKIKLILSSYTFIESKGAFSFPDGHSDCTMCQTDGCRQKCTKSVPKMEASRDDVCGYTCVVDGGWKEGVYTRVHRDFRIIKALRQFMGLNSNISPGDVGLPSHCA